MMEEDGTWCHCANRSDFRLKGVLDAGRVDEIGSQPATVQRKQRVQYRCRVARWRQLHAERAIYKIVANFRNVGGVQCPAKRRIVSNRWRKVELAITDLQLRHQIRGQSNSVGDPVVESDSTEHGIVLLGAGVIDVARVQVGREIAEAGVEDRQHPSRKLARPQKVLPAARREAAVHQKSEVGPWRLTKVNLCSDGNVTEACR